MSNASYIPVKTLCTHYKVETTFFNNLNEYGLVEITTVEKRPCIEEKQLKNLDAIVRLYQELHINLEGIDTVLNLLEKIDHLQGELQAARNKLRGFDDSF